MKRFLTLGGTAAFLAMALVGLSQPTAVGASWTLDWHCQLHSFLNQHRITEASIEYWADGTHEYWDNNCDVHSEFEPPDGGEGGGN